MRSGAPARRAARSWGEARERRAAQALCGAQGAPAP
ncbi:MAG: hypothetical protein QOD13_3766, partial [Thermoleophilaceae bacterium]|nr:hypothetical protein [Thermoleophilaceae bacterium]